MRKLILLTAALMSLYARSSDAAVPRTLNFQGRLTNAAGTAVTDGAYAITFWLYSAATAGTACHTETQTVYTSNGLFNTAIGQTGGISTVCTFGAPYWLELKVAPDTAVMAPRIPLTSAPFAIRAGSVDAKVGVASQVAAIGYCPLVSTTVATTDCTVAIVEEVVDGMPNATITVSNGDYVYLSFSGLGSNTAVAPATTTGWMYVNPYMVSGAATALIDPPTAYNNDTSWGTLATSGLYRATADGVLTFNLKFRSSGATNRGNFTNGRLIAFVIGKL